MTNQPQDIDALALEDLRRLVLGVLEENVRLRVEVAALREEVARLKGLKGKPDIKPPVKPSGMDKGTDALKNERADKKKRGSKSFRAAVEDRVVKAPGVPPGSQFKGYEDFTVEDLLFAAQVKVLFGRVIGVTNTAIEGFFSQLRSRILNCWGFGLSFLS